MAKSKGGTPVQQPDLLGNTGGHIAPNKTAPKKAPTGGSSVRPKGSAPPATTDAHDRKPSKAVAIAQPQQQVALKSSGDPMVDMYERALRDPSVDPAKLKALLDIRAEEVAREAHRHFNIALHDAQAKIPRIFANKSNKSTSSRYADYPSLDAAIRPIYVECGFGLTFNTGKSALAD